MTQLRKEDLSLYYYIKDTVLSDFIETDEMVELSLVEALSTVFNDDDPTTNSYVYETLTQMVPDPTERGRGWVYFDDPTASGVDEMYEDYYETINYSDICDSIAYITISGTNAAGTIVDGTPEQSTRVKVYDSDGVRISDSEYIIDYLDGRIVTSGTCSPAYVTYDWNYVSVVDEWAVVEAANPPVVVIDMQGTDKDGYQLGGGKKTIRKVEIHIFASNTAERNDLVEKIYDGLYNKSCPVYDFPLGGVLDYDGTWFGRKENMNKLTSLFDRTTLHSTTELHGNIHFDKVTARHVNLPLLMTRSRNEVMLSDLNAYRSKISFDLVSYTRR